VKPATFLRDLSSNTQALEIEVKSRRPAGPVDSSGAADLKQGGYDEVLKVFGFGGRSDAAAGLSAVFAGTGRGWRGSGL